MLIAEGAPPINGQNGRIVFHFDVDNKKKSPRIDSSGKVNFKELNYVVNIQGGFLLAQRIAPTKAQTGTDIFGTQLVGIDGVAVDILKGKNVTLSVDGSKYFAKCAGTPVYKDNELDILNKIMIDGNINYSIGNVNFVGDLEILGDVEQGFFVEAGKGIIINGNAIGGSIKAGRDLRVSNGIISSDRNAVNVGGSIYARFIENSNVIAGMDIVVSRWLLHNSMECGGILRVGDDGEGQIMGGNYTAGIAVIATEIGTELFVKTMVSVNYSSDYYAGDELYSYYAGLLREHYLLGDITAKAHTNIEEIKNSTKVHIYKKAAIVEEITENIFDSHRKKKSLEREIKDFRLFLIEKKYILEPIIIARNQVWPGAQIHIAGTLLKIRKPMGPTVFGFDNGKITVSKLEDKKNELHWLY